MSRRLALALSALFLAAPGARGQSLHVTPYPLLEFGPVYIGQSSTRAVNIENSGLGNVTVTDLQIWNMWQTPYTMVSPPHLPYTLASGEWVTVLIEFAPPDFSFWDGKLEIYSNSPTTPYVEVALRGFGNYPPPNPCFPLTSCNGVCVNTATDPENCGGCGNACDPPAGGTATCTAGVCGTDCGGLDLCGEECVDLTGDASNCGTCGFACDPPAGGDATCTAGVCGQDCGGLDLCGGACVDLTGDVFNCGTCGTVCLPPEGGAAVCNNGTCDTDCDGLTECSGACRDTATDVQNCGTCGFACPAPEHGTAFCAAGACGFTCDDGYQPEGNACVPVEARVLLVDLMDSYTAALGDGLLWGKGDRRASVVHAMFLWRHLDLALQALDQGWVAQACDQLWVAEAKSDGQPRPSDLVEGEDKALAVFRARLGEVQQAVGCPE